MALLQVNNLMFGYRKSINFAGQGVPLPHCSRNNQHTYYNYIFKGKKEVLHAESPSCVQK